MKIRPPKLTWNQTIAWHLRRQHLDRRLPRTKLLPLTSELCGLHAQVMSSAELTALCRIEGLQPDDISLALWSDRKLIKTWAMRSTLHLLPTEEYAQWLAAFRGYRVHRGDAWFRYFGITPEELERLTEACALVLRSRLVTREQLADEIVHLTGITNAHEKLRMGWGPLLRPACHRGYLCFGPNKGQLVQFTHPEIEPDAASADAFVARRFFATYGPATELDFARWFYGGRRTIRTMMESLGGELAEVDIEGTQAWMLRKDIRSASKGEPVKTVRLLPAFDQYVFAAGTRSAQLTPGDFHKRIYRNQGWFSPVLLVDGRMDGVWNFQRKRQTLHVTIEPFVKVPLRVKRAAVEEAERLAQYMQRTLELTWDTRISGASAREPKKAR